MVSAFLRAQQPRQQNPYNRFLVGVARFDETEISPYLAEVARAKVGQVIAMHASCNAESGREWEWDWDWEWD